MEDVEELECPVCMKLMKPPTSLCENGHVVCSACRPLLHQCPTCRTTFVNTKNTIMDKLLSRCKFPCDGCQLEMELEQLNIHENSCFYLLEMRCPFIACKEKLTPIKMEKHFHGDHKDDVNRHSFLVYDTVNGKYVNKFNYSIEIKKFELNLTVFFPHFCLPTQRKANKFIIQHKIENGKYFVVVKQLNEPSGKSFEVIMTVNFGKNEFRFCSEVLPFHVDEDAMWLRPNLVVEKQQCELFMGDEKMVVNCEIKEV